MFSQLLSSFAETDDLAVIKARAKEDAERVVSRLRWFGSGVGHPVLGICIPTLGILQSLNSLAVIAMPPAHSVVNCVT